MAAILFPPAPPPSPAPPSSTRSGFRNSQIQGKSLGVKERGRGRDQMGKESLLQPPEPPSAQQASESRSDVCNSLWGP